MSWKGIAGVVHPVIQLKDFPRWCYDSIKAKRCDGYGKYKNESATEKTFYCYNLMRYKLKCINTDWLSGEWEADDEWNAADLQSVWWIYVKVDQQMMNEMLLIYSLVRWIYVKVDPQDTSRKASGCVAVHLHALDDMWCDFIHKSQSVELHVLGLHKMACAGLFRYKIYMWCKKKKDVVHNKDVLNG